MTMDYEYDHHDKNDKDDEEKDSNGGGDGIHVHDKYGPAMTAPAFDLPADFVSNRGRYKLVSIRSPVGVDLTSLLHGELIRRVWGDEQRGGKDNGNDKDDGNARDDDDDRKDDNGDNDEAKSVARGRREGGKGDASRVLATIAVGGRTNGNDEKDGAEEEQEYADDDDEKEEKDEGTKKQKEKKKKKRGEERKQTMCVTVGEKSESDGFRILMRMEPPDDDDDDDDSSDDSADMTQKTKQSKYKTTIKTLTMIPLPHPFDMHINISDESGRFMPPPSELAPPFDYCDAASATAKATKPSSSVLTFPDPFKVAYSYVPQKEGLKRRWMPPGGKTPPVPAPAATLTRANVHAKAKTTTVTATTKPSVGRDEQDGRHTNTSDARESECITTINKDADTGTMTTKTNREKPNIDSNKDQHETDDCDDYEKKHKKKKAKRRKQSDKKKIER